MLFFSISYWFEPYMKVTCFVDTKFYEVYNKQHTQSTRRIISQGHRYCGGACSSQSIFPPYIIQVLLIPLVHANCSRRSEG